MNGILENLDTLILIVIIIGGAPAYYLCVHQAALDGTARHTRAPIRWATTFTILAAAAVVTAMGHVALTVIGGEDPTAGASIWVPLAVLAPIAVYVLVAGGIWATMRALARRRAVR